MRINKLCFLFLGLFNWLSSQSNQVIKYTDGALVKDENYYFSGQHLNLQTSDYAQNGAASVDSVSAASYRSVIQTTVGEQNVRFSTGNPESQFSLPIDLGFTFTFFGKEYTQAVVGSNGRVVFSQESTTLESLSNRNLFIDRTFAQNPTVEKLPSPKYNEVYASAPTDRKIPLAQIFAGFTLINSQASLTRYKYKPIQHNNVRGMMFSFQNIVTPNGRMNSHVLIFENGKVLILVENKTSKNYNAILGLQNDDGTRHIVYSERYNNGEWVSGIDGAFEFSTALTRTPSYEWKRNGTTQNSINRFYDFSPSENEETVSVKITFAEDTDGSLTKQGIVKFKRVAQPLVHLQYGNCEDPAVLSVDNFENHPDLTYKWFRVGASSEPLGTGRTFLANNSGAYFVRVEKTGTPSLYEESERVEVTVGTSIPAFSFADGAVFPFCDQNPSREKTLNLMEAIGYHSGTDYTVNFFENGTPISDYTNYSLSSGEVKNLQVQVETNPGRLPFCRSNLRHFTVGYQAWPPEGTVYESERLCQGTSAYTVDHFKAAYPELSEYEISLALEADASEVVDTVNPMLSPSVWVKLSLPGYSCQPSYKLNFRFQPSVEAHAPTTVLPAKCESEAVFDLSVLTPEINPSGGMKISFHRSQADAQSNTRAVSASEVFPVGATRLFIRVQDPSTGCVAQAFPSFEVHVFAKPRPNGRVPELAACKDKTFNLIQDVRSFFNQIDPSIAYTVHYFAPDGTALSEQQASTYDALNQGFSPYMEIRYNGACPDRIGYRLTFNPEPSALVASIPVCEEKRFTLADFKALVTDRPSAYAFLKEDGSPMADDFSLETLPYKIRFYLRDNQTGCLSALQEVSFISKEPFSLDTDEVPLNRCDEQGERFDGITVVDLTSAEALFTRSSSAIFTYYRDIARTHLIDNPKNYTNTSATEVIYVKVEAAGYCPSYAKINLNITSPSRSSTLKTTYFICHGAIVTVDAGGENRSFQWSNGQTGRTATFDAPGYYSVTMTNAMGCSYTHNFEISDEHQPVVLQLLQDNDKLEVLAKGNYPIEYSFNGGPFGSSNILFQPTADEYTVSVRSVLPDGTYCLGAPSSLYTLRIPNAFTPDGDGINELWSIKNLDKMQQVEIWIFDRFGRVVFDSSSAKRLEWNGKIQGRPLPTASYWYVVKWYDPGTLKNEQKQGWIFLKNRD
ncbi:T9SS type B sorting domain-containing protein [Bergeyella sp. RCAD1439]|uniref:T9SS type B sorting domain-containing protein n=1 Tax=Bergeyella anatis TaxID=3113737 RepID=UPI002E191AD4|nr:T9SS type B sorting domain-containing protein [Bergeyella sp. RCAD1439]